MSANDSGGVPSISKWFRACRASCTTRQLIVPFLKAATETNITCSSTSQIMTSPSSFDPARRNRLGSYELDQITTQSRIRVMDQLLSGIFSVCPVFSRPRDASTELSESVRTANQLIAYPTQHASFDRKICDRPCSFALRHWRDSIRGTPFNERYRDLRQSELVFLLCLFKGQESQHRRPASVHF